MWDALPHDKQKATYACTRSAANAYTHLCTHPNPSKQWEAEEHVSLGPSREQRGKTDLKSEK